MMIIFRSHYGSKTLEVAYTNNTAFLENEKQLLKCAPKSIEDVLRLAEPGQSSKATKYYLAQIPLREDFPELLDDIDVPSYIDATKLGRVNLWYGFGDNITPLHYDYSHNFLAQVRGNKKGHPHCTEVSYCFASLQLDLSDVSL